MQWSLTTSSPSAPPQSRPWESPPRPRPRARNGAHAPREPSPRPLPPSHHPKAPEARTFLTCRLFASRPFSFLFQVTVRPLLLDGTVLAQSERRELDEFAPNDFDATRRVDMKLHARPVHFCDLHQDERAPELDAQDLPPAAADDQAH